MGAKKKKKVNNQMLIKQNVKRKEFLCFLFFKHYFLVFFIVITFLLTHCTYFCNLLWVEITMFCFVWIISQWLSVEPVKNNNKENTTGDTKISFPEAKESSPKKTKQQKHHWLFYPKVGIAFIIWFFSYQCLDLFQYQQKQAPTNCLLLLHWNKW